MYFLAQRYIISGYFCKRLIGVRDISAANETMTLLIKFKVGGPLRFLSHAQMLMVFQRASVRAGLKLRYSKGFNPRPKMSLPLPRPVGIESDDELAILSLVASCSNRKIRNTTEEERIKAELSTQLPKGCELLSVCIDREKVSFQPSSEIYMLILKEENEYLLKKLKNTAKELLDSESLIACRPINNKDSRLKIQDLRLKKINVRDYLESIEFDYRKIMIKFRFTSTGSIRIQEILDLLNLDMDKLAAPIRRTNVQWQDSKN